MESARRFLELLRSQARQDLELKYVGSVAGAYWAVVNPLLQVAAYLVLVTGVFKARIAAAGDGRVDHALFLLAGLGPWLALHEAVVSAATCVVRHAGLVKNVAFPLGVLPCSAVVTSLPSLLVSLAATAGLALALGRPPGAALLALPLLVAIQLGLALGLGLLLCVVTTFLRDIGQLLPVVLQLVMLATPVVYSLAEAPGPLAAAQRWNPLFHLVQAYRDVLLAGAWPSPASVLGCAGVAAALLLAGAALFRRASGHFEAVV